MGRMRKEIRGRPPHSWLCSIFFSVSLNAVLLVLGDAKKRDLLALGCHVAAEMHRVTHSQQLLQRPLLKGLVGAVDDVGLKVVGSVVLDNVADVPDHSVLIVTPFKVLKETESRGRAMF